MTQQGGGLHIPQGLGATEQKLEDIAQRFNTREGVDRFLAEWGLQYPGRPQFALPPVTAEALTSADSRSYTMLYAQQLAWYNYLTPMLASIEVEVLQAENTLDLIDAEIKDAISEQNKTLPDKQRLSATEIKTKVYVHPAYQNALLRFQTMKQYQKQVKAVTDVAERNMAVISRQVEIRKMEFEGGKREGNIQHAGLRPIQGR